MTVNVDWDVIKANLAAFSKRWKGFRKEERKESQTFLNEFFACFGIDRLTAGVIFEHKVHLPECSDPDYKPSSGRIDLFWPAKIIIEMKSEGESLKKASAQLLKYVTWLMAKKDFEKPRFAMVCDFENFILTDYETGQVFEITLSKLAASAEKFWILLRDEGIDISLDPAVPINQTAVNHIERIYKDLDQDGYVGAPLQLLLVRIVFCLFADKSDIFNRNQFKSFIRHHTKSDGSDLGAALSDLFHALNTPVASRQRSTSDVIKAFPYINGGLFKATVAPPRCTADMRDRLLKACDFDWQEVSPDIFGAMFQRVMLPEDQKKASAHYTPKSVIKLTVGPMVIDPLRAKYRAAMELRVGRKEALEALHDEIARLRFIDPSCGCGNFLVVIYEELRLLEIDILKALHPRGLKMDNYADLSRIDVDHFAGIELYPHAAKIAEVALWMTDHLMNLKLRDDFGKAKRIPLGDPAKIVCGDALAVDWTKALDPKKKIRIGEADVDPIVYVVGNLPFKGAKKEGYETSRDAIKEIQRSFAAYAGMKTSSKDVADKMPIMSVDLAAAWIFKSVMYLGDREGGISLVVSNSLVQGVQVGRIWPAVFKAGFEFSHAYRPFLWQTRGEPQAEAAPADEDDRDEDEEAGEGADGYGKVAHVHVVIVGLKHTSRMPERRSLFYWRTDGRPLETNPSFITGYLSDGDVLSNPHVIVRKRRVPFASYVPPILTGNQPIDGGWLIIKDDAALDVIRAAAPKGKPFNVKKYTKPFIGARQLMNGNFSRRILCVDEVSEREYGPNAEIRRRLEETTKWRKDRDRQATRDLAPHPAVLGHYCETDGDYIAVPTTSSGNRAYVPIAMVSDDYMPSNLLLVVKNSSYWLLALMLSAAHMDWMRFACGRMNSDYRYSSELVYNTFPWPDISPEQRDRLETFGRQIHEMRTKSNRTLEDLYGSLTGSKRLFDLHRRLDRYVDSLYPIPLDPRSRISTLLALYEETVVVDEEAARRAKKSGAKRRPKSERAAAEALKQKKVKPGPFQLSLLDRLTEPTAESFRPSVPSPDRGAVQGLLF